MRRILAVVLVGSALVGCRAERSSSGLWPGQENSAVLGTDQTLRPRGIMIPPVYPGVDLAKRPVDARTSDRDVATSSLEVR